MAKAKSTAPSTDDKILQLIEVVNKKKAEISQAENPKYKTNCSFSFSEESAVHAINLHTVSDLSLLVKIISFLIEKQISFSKAADSLGLSELNFTWLGYSAGDWNRDIVTRINKIQIKKKKDELEVLEAKLEKLISPELRAKLELEAIQKELGL